MKEPTESTDAAAADAEPSGDTTADWIPAAMRGSRAEASVENKADRDQPAPRPLPTSLPSSSAGDPTVVDGEIATSLVGRIAGIEDRLQGAQAELAERQVAILATLGEDRAKIRAEMRDEIDALRESLAAQGRSLEETVEVIKDLQAGLVDKQKRGLTEVKAVLNELAAQKPRIDSLEDALDLSAERVAEVAERARLRSEERITAVVNELRERLRVQSERLTESEEAARDRAAGFDRSLDTAVADIRGEIDEAQKRTELLCEEVTTLGDAMTAKLAELGARLAAESSPGKNVSSLPGAASEGAKPASIANSLDAASFEELRSTGLSVTQAARLIAYRNTLERSLVAEDLDQVAGLQDDLRETLKQMLER